MPVKHEKNSFFFLVLLLLNDALLAQVGINIDNSTPDPSAGLDVNLSDKGFLPPWVEMTATSNHLLVGMGGWGEIVKMNFGDGDYAYIAEDIDE